MNRFLIDPEKQFSAYSKVHPYKDGKYLVDIQREWESPNKNNKISKEIYFIDNKIEKVFSSEMNFPEIEFEKYYSVSLVSTSEDKNPTLKFYRSPTRTVPLYTNDFFDLFTGKQIATPLFRDLDHGIGYVRVGNKGISKCAAEPGEDDEQITWGSFNFFLGKDNIKKNEVILFNFHEEYGFSHKVMQVCEESGMVMNVALSYDQLTAAALIYQNKKLEVVVIDLE